MDLNYNQMSTQDPAILAQLWAQQQAQNQPPAPASPQASSVDASLLIPGKTDPATAIQHIGELHAQKYQMLQRDKSGALTESIKASPIERLFGKQTRQIPLQDQTNYYDTAEGVLGPGKAQKLLPSGLPMTPEGKPVLNKTAYDQLMEAARLKGEKANDVAITDPGKLAFARAFVEQRAPETLDGFDRMVKSGQFTEKMFAQLPSYATGRQDYFGNAQFITTPTGYKAVTMNSKDGTFKVLDLPTGQLPSKSRAATSEETEFFGKAETLNNVMQQVAKFYSDDKVGPFAGRAGRALDVYTPLTDSERSSLRNYTAKMFNNMIYLRSGKAINQEEANRMGEEFMNIYNTPGAFKSAFDSLQNEFVWLVDSRRNALKTGMVANADQFAPSIKANERIQLKGTEALDGFLSKYDSNNKTNYAISNKDEAAKYTQFLQERGAKITPANLKAAKEFLDKQGVK